MVGDAGETRTVLVENTGEDCRLLELVCENLDGDMIDGGIGRFDEKRERPAAPVFILN